MIGVKEAVWFHYIADMTDDFIPTWKPNTEQWRIDAYWLYRNNKMKQLFDLLIEHGIIKDEE